MEVNQVNTMSSMAIRAYKASRQSQSEESDSPDQAANVQEDKQQRVSKAQDGRLNQYKQAAQELIAGANTQKDQDVGGLENNTEKVLKMHEKKIAETLQSKVQGTYMSIDSNAGSGNSIDDVV